MGFLKFIVAVMTMFLLYFFIGNVLQWVFPAQGVVSQYNAQVECAEKYPDSYSENSDPEAYRQASQAREKAIEDCVAAQSDAEGGSPSYLTALYRSVTILLVLVGIAVAIFRRYPYLASALVLVGVALVVFYPLTHELGDLFSYFMAGSDADEADVRQIQMVKTLLQGVGVAALIAADVFFFEKAQAKPTDVPPSQA